MSKDRIDKNSWPFSLQSKRTEKNLVSEFLGNRWPINIKVFHSVYIDVDDHTDLSHDDIYKKHAKPSKNEFEKLIENATLIGQGIPDDLVENFEKYKKITWEQLFTQADLNFTAKANPDILRSKFKGQSFPSNLYGLCEYGFDYFEINSLSKIMERYGYDEVNCFYDYLSSGLLGDVDEIEDAELLFRVKTKELSKLIGPDTEKAKFYFTPNFIWSDDRSFLIWSDYDLPYSFIGCNDYFYTLIKSSGLEYIKYDGDLPYNFVGIEEYLK